MTRTWNNSNYCLAVLNKIQVLIPIVLLVGSDGTRGDESLIAIGGSFVLAIMLSILEGSHLRAVSTAAICALSTVAVCSAQLLFFEAMKVFRGPLGYYGLPKTIGFLTGFLLLAGALSAWVDTRKGRTA